MPVHLLAQHPEPPAGQYIHTVAGIALPEETIAAVEIHPFEKSLDAAERIIVQRSEKCLKCFP